MNMTFVKINWKEEPMFYFFGLIAFCVTLACWILFLFRYQNVLLAIFYYFESYLISGSVSALLTLQSTIIFAITTWYILMELLMEPAYNKIKMQNFPFLKTFLIRLTRRLLNLAGIAVLYLFAISSYPEPLFLIAFIVAGQFLGDGFFKLLLKGASLRISPKL